LNQFEIRFIKNKNQVWRSDFTGNKKTRAPSTHSPLERKFMNSRNRYFWAGIVTVSIGIVSSVTAFCGFYVGRVDAKLYNKASQIMIARDGERTTITMVSDYQGALKDFALVVPVPKVLKRAEIGINDSTIIDKLDAYSAPRLVEYFDADPCNPQPVMAEDAAKPMSPSVQNMATRGRLEKSLGVTVEARYSVGEYSIVILSATQSDGLETYLLQEGYKIPAGASKALAPYIKAGMNFFVAKVNLKKVDSSGVVKLRPIRMSFKSKGFMLPLQLGMINANGTQDLTVYSLTRKGRVEAANYQTVKVPSDKNIPEFVQPKFSDFYGATFKKAYEREGKNAVFLEYAWTPNSCDPCASEPPDIMQLRAAGAFWLAENPNDSVFFTRLHVRYDAANFKEDLMFKQTSNTENFQARYIMQHPFKGSTNCGQAGEQYRNSLKTRLETEAQTTANLTGWDINSVRQQIKNFR
jgi:hypothetical protein